MRFDGREWNDAWPALRAHAQASGVRLLERETCELADRDGTSHSLARHHALGRLSICTAWRSARAMRSGGYFMRLMQATRDGRAVRRCRDARRSARMPRLARAES